ncbi:Glycerol-3-phosphate cytidylyltransferase [Phocoenobacter uteri]|uniref:Glycerol-3-phosphate cytidylyltransferase n=1 Tax=Phocoenobacter uteri TaxID=146806 RepID=A0A379CAY9_9PAST|nr:Gfo/Idh/MocA family oxidoreductase [Phocoenobacter uteri]MDG6881413.1 hypothetical protein [Phocoenobacter uteri]SUB59441.1 Glycerol-3-phosphate cytidylyltransferase [Phocoenobacter uteri]
MKTVITYGSFDLFHQGHINLLKRAKAFGDKLIVGVTSELYDRERGKFNVVNSLEERVKTIQNLPFVDEVIIEYDKDQKPKDIQELNVDVFVIGDDWKGHFDYLKDFCEVIYLPRTPRISSTQLRQDLNEINIGVIGTGRIANRFVSSIDEHCNVIVKSAFSRNIQNVNDFITRNGISYGFDDIDKFLNSGIDAVYIASPHQTHFEYAKKCILSNKHVLCEKPVTLNKCELEELIILAEQQNVVFMEAIKTAFLPAFSQLLSELESGIIGDILEVRATFTKLVDDKNAREYDCDFGGATNELASYPLLLATKVLGNVKDISFYPIMEDKVDIANRIVTTHENGNIAISTVGIGMKQEGCAVISGTKGYIYIPAPWWLTKKFFIRFENTHKEIELFYDFVGDGLHYEISEFVVMIRRQKTCSDILSCDEMKEINKVISKFQEEKA